MRTTLGCVPWSRSAPPCSWRGSRAGAMHGLPRAPRPRYRAVRRRARRRAQLVASPQSASRSACRTIDAEGHIVVPAGADLELAAARSNFGGSRLSGASVEEFAERLAGIATLDAEAPHSKISACAASASSAPRPAPSRRSRRRAATTRHGARARGITRRRRRHAERRAPRRRARPIVLPASEADRSHDRHRRTPSRAGVFFSEPRVDTVRRTCRRGAAPRCASRAGPRQEVDGEDGELANRNRCRTVAPASQTRRRGTTLLFHSHDAIATGPRPATSTHRDFGGEGRSLLATAMLTPSTERTARPAGPAATATASQAVPAWRGVVVVVVSGAIWPPIRLHLPSVPAAAARRRRCRYRPPACAPARPAVVRSGLGFLRVGLAPAAGRALVFGRRRFRDTSPPSRRRHRRAGVRLVRDRGLLLLRFLRDPPPRPLQRASPRSVLAASPPRSPRARL